MAVSDVVWEKPGSLNAHEWEQVRLHAYHSERILAGSERLASLAPMVGMHHERLDGGGYHRGCRGAELPMPARTLAAADAYQAMTQPRPHRPALAPDQAEQRLLADARKGSSTATPSAPCWPRPATPGAPPPDAAGGAERPRGGGARPGRGGCSNAQIAQRLVISRRTAEHHVQHIYTKIGVSSRAAAALFAMEHHLLPGGIGSPTDAPPVEPVSGPVDERAT